MVLTYSTRNDLISELERTSVPWIRREDYANTALGSHSRNIWAPQHPPHTFDVCLVHHKLARRFWMSAANVLCISKDIERTEQEVHTYSVSHVRVSCGSQVGELGTPACGLVLSFNHERGVCSNNLLNLRILDIARTRADIADGNMSTKEPDVRNVLGHSVQVLVGVFTSACLDYKNLLDVDWTSVFRCE